MCELPSGSLIGHIKLSNSFPSILIFKFVVGVKFGLLCNTVTDQPPSPPPAEGKYLNDIGSSMIRIPKPKSNLTRTSFGGSAVKLKECATVLGGRKELRAK